jgi:hypothetical protein
MGCAAESELMSRGGLRDLPGPEPRNAVRPYKGIYHKREFTFHKKQFSRFRHSNFVTNSNSAFWRNNAVFTIPPDTER